MPRDAAYGAQAITQLAGQAGEPAGRTRRTAADRRDGGSHRASDAPAVRGQGSAVPYRVEEQVGFLLRRAHQRATALFQSLIGDRDITPTQYTSLIKLLEHGELSQNRLGRLVAMDKATAQGVVRRLKARQLVAARSDPGDARRTLLKLTPGGRKLAEQLLTNGPLVSQETLKPLAASERRMLLDLLRRLA
jgi:DNA-binding MarR family transcriptional regulator